MDPSKHYNTLEHGAVLPIADAISWDSKRPTTAVQNFDPASCKQRYLERKVPAAVNQRPSVERTHGAKATVRR